MQPLRWQPAEMAEVSTSRAAASIDAVAVKELILSSHNPETIVFAI